jgi:hypothetical protein
VAEGSCAGDTVITFEADGGAGKGLDLPDAGSSSESSCSTLLQCCGELPASSVASCDLGASSNIETQCANDLAEARAAGYCLAKGSGFAVLGADGGSGDTTSTIETTDGGTTESADGGTSTSSYCHYATDAGNDCSYETSNPDTTTFPCGCTGSQGSVSQAAQTELNCMAGGGSIVAVCPSEGLVGCCTSSYGGFPGYPDGNTVACSYGEGSQYKLQCLAQGGTWSTTAPD